MSRIVGKAGEDLASEILESKGYQIVERNFLTRFGEIDIVARDASTICFVEVKYRRDEGFGTAAEFVTGKKLEKILKTAKIFLKDNELFDIDWRIDVLAIERETEKFELIKNVFIEGL